MSTRFAKQLIYAAFYIVLWALVIWGGYHIFVSPAPPSVAAPTVQPVGVLAVNMLPTPGVAGHDTFLARVENPNSDFAAQTFDYSFNVYDASGTLLQSFPGESFLYGSEIKYVLLVNQAVPSGAMTADITIPTTTTLLVTTSTFGAVPQLAIQNLSTVISSLNASASGTVSLTGGTVSVSGQIVDNDTASFNNVLIIAVFKDASGDPLGASETELDRIVPGQSENVAITYPVIAGINTAATEVEVYAER